MEFLKNYSLSINEILQIINFPEKERDEFVSSFTIEAIKNVSFDLIELIDLDLKSGLDSNPSETIKILLEDSRFQRQLQLKFLAIVQAFADEVSLNLLVEDKDRIENIIKHLISSF